MMLGNSFIQDRGSRNLYRLDILHGFLLLTKGFFYKYFFSEFLNPIWSLLIKNMKLSHKPVLISFLVLFFFFLFYILLEILDQVQRFSNRHFPNYFLSIKSSTVDVLFYMKKSNWSMSMWYWFLNVDMSWINDTTK